MSVLYGSSGLPAMNAVHRTMKHITAGAAVSAHTPHTWKKFVSEKFHVAEVNLQRQISVKPLLLPLVSHLHQQHLKLFDRPPKTICKSSHTQTTDPIQKSHEKKKTSLP